MKSVSAVAVVLCAALGWSGVATAQKTSGSSDWSVFEEGNPKECWAVSAPLQAVSSRDGKVIVVRRGDIQLFVTFLAGKSANGEVSFTGGYPFASGSTVVLDVDGRKFELFTDGEWAWPVTREIDAAIIAAMKKGTQATLVARSDRGTVTTDKFSLRGFTASVNDAANRCGIALPKPQVQAAPGAVGSATGRD